MMRIEIHALSITVSLGLLWAQAAGDEPVMRAHFIDVGQGASTLLEFPCGTILIDTGGQDPDHSERLKDFLRDFFARRSDLSNTLSVLIVSHPHIDHTRGIKGVFEACRVLKYVDNGMVAG